MKSEIRNPKSETSINREIGNVGNGVGCLSSLLVLAETSSKGEKSNFGNALFRVSDFLLSPFEFVSDFGFRISDFA